MGRRKGQPITPEELTTREREVVDLISQFRSEKGYSPAVDEVAKGIGLSPSGTHGVLMGMRDRGLVSWALGKNRTLRVVEDPPRCAQGGVTSKSGTETP